MNIYDNLGVRPFINARAPHTRFGGATMPRVVVEAMAEAARFGVDMEALQGALHARLAELTRNEAAFISCGAASGLALVIAACMTGTNRRKIEQLPDTSGLPDEVVVQQAARFDEDICLQVPGARVIQVGSTQRTTERQIIEALGPNTAAVVTCDWDGCLPVATLVEIASERNVPVIVDAAGDVPPIHNFWRYTRDLGASAVVVSGGKGLRGPQSTGLVLGKRALIDGCIANGNPNRAIGRTMKVAKEEMIGLYAAVQHLINTADQQLAEMRVSADRMVSTLSAANGTTITRDPPFLLLDVGKCPGFRSADQMMADLRNGEPSILALCRGTTLWLNVSTLEPGQDELVTARVLQILNAAD